MKKILLPLAAGIILLSCAINKKTAKTINAIATTVKADSAKRDSTKKLKPYSEVVTAKAITRNGLLKVHEVNDRWFFEIPDSLLNKDILVVNRITKAPSTGAGMYGGDWIGENVIQFVKGPSHKMLIQRMSYRDVSRDSTENGMYRSVLNSSLQPIVASFDIKALAPDSAGYVIDVTDFLNGDNDVFFFDTQLKKDAFQLGSLQADKSFIKTILSFPLNTEIKTIKTYTAAANTVQQTYELNSSLVLLPSSPMRPRYFDDRVGYFSRGYIDYDQPQRVKVDYMITRWRLEPKEEDMEKYKRGELVEPKKPIVFYIDPATPKKWIPYLIDGVNAWQKAFEKAGFKNAIYALEAPANDSTWSLEDARHNAIVYKASPIQNASGPQVSDPRTGEILESHINWYHNVQQLLHDWYLVQAGPNDTRGRKAVFDDDLMGNLIKMVCTHEVGHTLGLLHNFVASSTVPTDSLRSSHYIAINGHTPSIMDYARFNYVAQPEDHIAIKDLIPQIGIYDEWAIEWGYRLIPSFKSADEEATYMNQWITAQLLKDHRLFFSDIYPLDPRNRMEDLGDDAMKAGYYGIKNLQRVMQNLKEWSAVPNSINYRDMSRLHQKVVDQYRLYLMNAASNIGGLLRTPRTMEQGGKVLGFVPKETQREAVRFLSAQLFDTPKWLDDKDLYPYIGGGFVIWLYKIQESVIHNLVGGSMWNHLIFGETMLPKEKAYSYNELLDDLENAIYKELTTHQPIDIYRRTVQKIYAVKLMNMTRFGREGDNSMLDPFTVGTARIRQLYQKLSAALPGYTDKESRDHLQDLCTRLKAALDYQKEAFPGVAPTPSRGGFMFNKPDGIQLMSTEPLHSEQLDKGCSMFTEDSQRKWASENNRY